MKRRNFLHLGCIVALPFLSGCNNTSETPADDSGTSPTVSEKEKCSKTSTKEDPREPYDELSIFQVPNYVSEYETVAIIGYNELDSGAQRAIDQALSTNKTYVDCINDGTEVKKLFNNIEQVWGPSADDLYDSTYISYDDNHYAIRIVQEGDNVKVDSIPCTEESCPATPTPPS
ncbi:hypothetical protein [Halosimplex amylolyticum]|uniref:hypothetical protein n=1 Tax=Halosimplex amylolyticum TaxID=3396616 RepID=UPI003F571F13